MLEMGLEMFQTFRKCGEGTNAEATGPRLFWNAVLPHGRDRFALGPVVDAMNLVEVSDHVAPSLAREPIATLRFALIHVMTCEVTVIWSGDTTECTHKSMIRRLKPPAMHTNIRLFMFFFFSSPIIFVLITVRFVSKTASTPIPAWLVSVALTVTCWNANLVYYPRSKDTGPTCRLGLVDPMENYQVIITL